jgi:CheY-like chemotaxis protein
MNLVINARDAMPSGGRLVIETANVEIGEQDAAIHDGVAPGRYVMLAVSDSGTGMDAETRRRIFEPFFTTKEKGKGTGLGLSTCYGIVKQSGGCICVYSEVGHGTVFKIYLPRVDARPDVDVRKPVAPAELRGNETILVIEDDSMVRSAVGRMLTEQGYKVLSAGDGYRAFAIAKLHEKPIELVLSDVIVPGLSGPEAVSRVQQCCPKTKSLFMSGYTDHAILRNGVLEAGMNFIQKPFSPHALAMKVREVLDAQRA